MVLRLRLALIALVLSAVGCAPAAPLPKLCATTVRNVGGPVALVDAAGRAVTEADFAGTPTVLYFGFANCPDICPTSLQTLRAAFDARKSGATAVRAALVTLDPERDSPAILARYTASEAFPAGLVGLTGTRAQVDAAAAAFKVMHQKRVEKDSAVGYVVDHSSLFYLMGPDWKTEAVFPSELPPAEMAACIDAALRD